MIFDGYSERMKMTARPEELIEDPLEVFYVEQKAVVETAIAEVERLSQVVVEEREPRGLRR